VGRAKRKKEAVRREKKIVKRRCEEGYPKINSMSVISLQPVQAATAEEGLVTPLLWGTSRSSNPQDSRVLASFILSGVVFRKVPAMEKKKKACSKLVEDQIIKAYKFLDEKWSPKFCWWSTRRPIKEGIHVGVRKRNVYVLASMLPQ
jgi:hypothetical protein